MRDVAVLLAAGLVMGVGMPMVVARIIRRSSLLDLLLLGEKGPSKGPSPAWPGPKAQLIRVEGRDQGIRNR